MEDTKQAKYGLGRSINGISLNGQEFVLDGPEGDVKEFDSKEEAKQFLFSQGATQADFDDSIYNVVRFKEDGGYEVL